MSEPVGPVHFSVEDLESVSSPQPPKLEEIKLEGDGIPDIVKGKTAAEAVNMVTKLQEALQVSENARLQAQQIAKLASEREPTRLIEPPKPEPELTPEQLAQLHQENPLAAIEYMQNQAVSRATKNLESRLGSLFSSTSAAVEDQMRKQYALEFELFGEDINRLAATVPNKEQVLSNPAAWDDMISLVRGRKGNLERYVARVGQKEPAAQRAAAQAAEAANVGFSESSPTRTAIPRNVEQLDATQKEIADKLGISHADYVKYANVTSLGR